MGPRRSSRNAAKRPPSYREPRSPPDGEEYIQENRSHSPDREIATEQEAAWMAEHKASLRQIRRINRAFDAMHSRHAPDSIKSSRKRKRRSSEQDAIEADPYEMEGGFLPEDAVDLPQLPYQAHADYDTLARTTDDDHLSFERIPDALHRLRLDPHDEEVLQIFRDAALNWRHEKSNVTDEQPASAARTSRHGKGKSLEREQEEDTSEADMYISRDDWVAVCAILVQQQDLERQRSRNKDVVKKRPHAMSSDEGVDVSMHSDAYTDHEHDSESGSELSEESDYSPEASSSGKMKPVAVGHSSTMNPRQVKAARQIFEMFLDVGKCKNKKLDASSIHRISTLVEGGKQQSLLKSEIDEMFYMSPHQSYYDEETFIQFLIRARLV